MNYVHKKINITVPLGQTLGEGRIRLPEGQCLGMGVISTGNDPAQFVDLSVLDNGSEIVEGSDYRFYVKTNGGKWIDSLRPITFNCNRTVDVRLAATTALAAALNVQVIFVIVQQ